jgi:CheY-like chemotaxis protein
VIEAQDAKAAFDIIESPTAIDLLLTDIVMPGVMDGVELARVAVQLRPALKTLLTSGYADLANRQTAPDIQVLQKPYRRNDLLRLVHDRLHGEGGRSAPMSRQPGRGSVNGKQHEHRSSDALADAERNVRAAERRVTRQIVIVKKLESSLRKESVQARSLLAILETSAALARSALRARSDRPIEGRDRRGVPIRSRFAT